MNERHRKLYEYLLAKGDQWTSQAEIARDLFDEYGNEYCVLDPQGYHDTAERSILLKDLQHIATSGEFEKLVISSSKGVKIATEEEFSLFINRQYKAAIKKLHRICEMAKKGAKNDQFTFDGKAVEAFLKKNEDKAEKERKFYGWKLPLLWVHKKRT